MRDQEIIQLLFQRAEIAITALKDRFSRQIRAVAANILADSRDVDEAESDTYLALWNAIPPQRPDPLEPFALRTGRNSAMNIWRRNTAQKRGGGYDLSLEELELCLGSRSLEETVEQRALAQAIDNYLDTLKKRDRLLFMHRYWFGDSMQTLSREHCLPIGTVASRLNRIRQGLRTHLVKEGFLNE